LPQTVCVGVCVSVRAKADKLLIGNSRNFIRGIWVMVNHSSDKVSVIFDLDLES